MFLSCAWFSNISKHKVAAHPEAFVAVNYTMFNLFVQCPNELQFPFLFTASYHL